MFAHKNVVPPALMPPLNQPAPTFADPPLLMHVRLIDDAFQIWDLAKMPLDMRLSFQDHMKRELQFGQLTWTVTKLSKSIDFLDLTIDIEEDGSISTRTYVKPMN